MEQRKQTAMNKEITRDGLFNYIKWLTDNHWQDNKPPITFLDFLAANIASKYGLSAPVTDEQSLLDEIDWELMQMEDYTHGKDGERITALRAKIAARKHSVTPIMSEQEIKEEAEKYADTYYGYNPKSVCAVDLAAYKAAKKAYIAAISAHNKQHTE